MRSPPTIRIPRKRGRIRAKVLYLEGAFASARYLSGALTASGFDVTMRPPTAVASVTANLDAFDLVILSDIDRKAILDASMNALADWVEKALRLAACRR